MSNPRKFFPAKYLKMSHQRKFFPAKYKNFAVGPIRESFFQRKFLTLIKGYNLNCEVIYCHGGTFYSYYFNKFLSRKCIFRRSRGFKSQKRETNLSKSLEKSRPERICLFRPMSFTTVNHTRRNTK